MSIKTALIGVGNVLFTDEGVGVYAVNYLAKNYTFDDSLTIIDGGVLGFKLMGYFQEFDNVIILDTVSIEDEPGSVYRLPSDELLGLGTYRKTAHEVEIVEMLEICSMLESMANVVIMGIIPKDIESVSSALTPEIRTGLGNFLDATLNELTSIGISYQKKNDIKMDEIIENFFKEDALGFEI